MDCSPNAAETEFYGRGEKIEGTNGDAKRNLTAKTPSRKGSYFIDAQSMNAIRIFRLKAGVTMSSLPRSKDQGNCNSFKRVTNSPLIKKIKPLREGLYLFIFRSVLLFGLYKLGSIQQDVVLIIDHDQVHAVRELADVYVVCIFLLDEQLSVNTE